MDDAPIAAVPDLRRSFERARRRAPKSPWAAPSRTRWGFFLTGIIVAVLQATVTPYIVGALQGLLGPVTTSSWFGVAIMSLPAHAVIVTLAGLISWHVLSAERQAGHPPALIDAAAGPGIMSLICGVTYAVFAGDIGIVGMVAVGFGVSTLGFWLSARRGREAGVTPVDEPAATARVSAGPTFPIPVRWRRSARRFLFLTASTLIVAVLTVFVVLVYRAITTDLREGASDAWAMATSILQLLLLAGLLVNASIVVLCRTVHHLTPKRAFARSGIIWGVVFALVLVMYLYLWRSFASQVPLTLFVVGTGFLASAAALRLEDLVAVRAASSRSAKQTEVPTASPAPARIETIESLTARIRRWRGWTIALLIVIALIFFARLAGTEHPPSLDLAAVAPRDCAVTTEPRGARVYVAIDIAARYDGRLYPPTLTDAEQGEVVGAAIVPALPALAGVSDAQIERLLDEVDSEQYWFGGPGYASEGVMLIAIAPAEREGTIDGVNVRWGLGEMVIDQAIALSIEYSRNQCAVLVGRTMDEGDDDG